MANVVRPRDSLSSNVLHQFGIPKTNFEKVDTLENLKLNPPNIIITQPINNSMFSQDRSRIQKLQKNVNYIMSVGAFFKLNTYNGIKFLKPSNIKFKNIYKPYEGQDLSNKSLLIFRQGGIGDLLFIQPNLIYLKNKYPTCKIKFACGPQYQSMVSEWDCIDEIIDMPFTINHMFDCDYHAIFEGVIERCKEAEKICSYNLFTKWLGLNLDDNLLLPSQKPNQQSLENCKRILKNELKFEEKDFIIIQPTASSIVRTPSPQIWIKLINKLIDKKYNILITDSPHKSKIINNSIISKVKDEKYVKDFSIYSNSISDTIAMTSLSKLAIATDSSLPHIAESLFVKSFSIMGPFPGELRYSTYKNNDYINVKSSCAPCFLHGSNPCKFLRDKYSSCYFNLDYELAINKIESLLNV